MTKRNVRLLPDIVWQVHVLRKSESSTEAFWESIYAPPAAQVAWRLGDLYTDSEIRYFSYGRLALAEALRGAGVGRGDAVALPAFICREILSALHAVGAKPCFYPVGRRLALSIDPAVLPPTKAILAVNYFGFPQDLTPFRDYCRRTGAVLIEDNAHGLFSQDEDGTLLGQRGELAIFSLRKTIPLSEGAFLLLNTKGSGSKLNPQEPFAKVRETFGTCIKQGARKLIPLVGYRPVARLIDLRRQVRRLITGSEFPRSAPDAEQMFPLPRFSSAHLAQPLRCADPAREVHRRRALYELVDAALKQAGLEIEPVFPFLPHRTVPHGYPFYSSPAEWVRVQEHLRQLGLFSWSWPDLPLAIKGAALDHYTQLRNVPFLW